MIAEKAWVSLQILIKNKTNDLNAFGVCYSNVKYSLKNILLNDKKMSVIVKILQVLIVHYYLFDFFFI